MMANLVRIKINTSEENMDLGYATLLNSGLSIRCLRNEEYIVPKEAIARLNSNNVKFEYVFKA